MADITSQREHTVHSAGEAETNVRGGGRSPARRRALGWALAGALWGLLGFLFDYVMAITRLVCGFSARWPLVWDALWWVLPSRWAVRLDEALDPHGHYRILFLGDTIVVWIAASVLLGTVAGLGVWLLAHWIRRIAGRHQS